MLTSEHEVIFLKKDKEKKKKHEKQQVISDFSSSKDALPYLMKTLGGKWKIGIIWALRSGQSRRYGEIKADLPQITDMMLSQSLRDMSEDGLLQRFQFQEIPPRVEYQLTQTASGLVPAISLLIQWAEGQLKEELS